MSVQELYDDTSPEIWKKVIGEDLHYHVGWGEGDILYNAVEHLYQFIGKESTVLDCGCGWGGPAKAIKRDLHCDITSVTNSPVQYDYIKNNVPIDVTLARVVGVILGIQVFIQKKVNFVFKILLICMMLILIYQK